MSPATNVSSTDGQCVRAFEITELTETAFSEVLVSNGPPLVGASGSGDAAVGMHVVSHLPLPDGRFLRASDAWHTQPENLQA